MRDEFIQAEKDAKERASSEPNVRDTDLVYQDLETDLDMRVALAVQSAMENQEWLDRTGYTEADVKAGKPIKELVPGGKNVKFSTDNLLYAEEPFEAYVPSQKRDTEEYKTDRSMVGKVDDYAPQGVIFSPEQVKQNEERDAQDQNLDNADRSRNMRGDKSLDNQKKQLQQQQDNLEDPENMQDLALTQPNSMAPGQSGPNESVSMEPYAPGQKMPSASQQLDSNEQLDIRDNQHTTVKPVDY